MKPVAVVGCHSASLLAPEHASAKQAQAQSSSQASAGRFGWKGMGRQEGHLQPSSRGCILGHQAGQSLPPLSPPNTGFEEELSQASSQPAPPDCLPWGLPWDGLSGPWLALPSSSWGSMRSPRLRLLPTQQADFPRTGNHGD